MDKDANILITFSKPKEKERNKIHITGQPKETQETQAKTQKINPRVKMARQ